MKISELVEELQGILKEEGDIEVTCTGSTLRDGHGGAIPDVFETTVENLVIVRDLETPWGYGSGCTPRVRLYL